MMTCERVTIWLLNDDGVEIEVNGRHDFVMRVWWFWCAIGFAHD